MASRTSPHVRQQSSVWSRLTCRLQAVAGALGFTPRRIADLEPRIRKLARSHLDRLEGEGRVAFRYAEGTNPNGSLNDIAGILNDRGNVLGLMPHPENLIENLVGGTDGKGLFASLVTAA